MPQPTSAQLIRAIGPALFGDRWKTDMGVAIGVANRTIRRWVSGEDEPRAAVWDDLLEIMRERQAQLGELIAAVETHAGRQ